MAGVVVEEQPGRSSRISDVDLLALKVVIRGRGSSFATGVFWNRLARALTGRFSLLLFGSHGKV
jgi:hypothetical protein